MVAASVDTKQPSFLLRPFYPPRQAILTTVTATCKLSIIIYFRGMTISTTTSKRKFNEWSPTGNGKKAYLD